MNESLCMEGARGARGAGGCASAPSLVCAVLKHRASDTLPAGAPGANSCSLCQPGTYSSGSGLLWFEPFGSISNHNACIVSFAIEFCHLDGSFRIFQSETNCRTEQVF